MSAPLDYENKISGVVNEIISAESSLNMEPDPIENPPEEAMFLSETDKCVKHAMEHLRKAVDLTEQARKDIQLARDGIYQLWKDLVLIPGINTEKVSSLMSAYLDKHLKSGI